MNKYQELLLKRINEAGLGPGYDRSLSYFAQPTNWTIRDILEEEGPKFLNDAISILQRDIEPRSLDLKLRRMPLLIKNVLSTENVYGIKLINLRDALKMVHGEYDGIVNADRRDFGSGKGGKVSPIRIMVYLGQREEEFKEFIRGKTEKSTLVKITCNF